MPKSWRVLIVDDEPKNLQILGHLLKDAGVSVALATGADQALRSIEVEVPDLLILDIMMPGVDGFSLAQQIRRRPGTLGTPIIFISALTDEDSLIRSFDVGGVDYITKPFRSREVLTRVFTHLELQSYRRDLEEQVRRQVLELEAINTTLVEVLENANTFRDDETGQHIHRVTEYAKLLATGLDLPESTRREIGLYASLHDIGKVGIPDAILRKPGRLNDEEQAIMRNHAQIGYSILDRPGMPLVAKNIVLSHHEKWDGSGYPNGLSGTKIPAEARVVALADVYDALRSQRIYKPAFSRDETESIISSESGRHFDPALVAYFTSRSDEFDKVFRSFGRRDDPTLQTRG